MMYTYYIFVIISTCLSIAIVCLGWRRRLFGQFRWFFIFILYMFAESMVGLAIVHNSHLYFWFYWSAEIVQLALLAMAVRESFLHTLTNCLGMSLVRIGLWVSVSAALIYSVLRAFIAPPVNANRVIALIISTEITAHYLVAAISLLYLILWVLIRLPGRPYEVGIIVGFFLNACLSGAGYLTRSTFGMRFLWLWTWLPAVAFVAAQCAWVAILCRGYWLVSKTEAKVIVDLIPDVQSTYISELEEVLASDTKAVSSSANVARKEVEQVRIRWICQWLVKIRHNIELFHAAGRYEVAKISSGTMTKHDTMMAQQLLQEAIFRHCMVIIFQKYFQFLLKLNSLAWPVTSLVVNWTFRKCSAEVEAYCVLQQTMLTVTRTYGRIHYENLLAAL